MVILQAFALFILFLSGIGVLFLANTHVGDFTTFEGSTWKDLLNARSHKLHHGDSVDSGGSGFGSSSRAGMLLKTKEDFSKKEGLEVSTGLRGGGNVNKVGVAGKRRRRVAYAITITKDGNFQDGAAVLAYSILKHSQPKQQHSIADSYDISFVAFVHPLVKDRDSLRKIGFHVIEAPLPINVTAIHGKFLREKINNNGCCGAAELIKLSSYRLTQYDWVVHMDADTFVNGDISELLFPSPSDIDSQIDANAELSLAYTTDPNMATHKGEDKMPAQGGFLLIRPSEKDFRGIVDTLMTTEFKSGGAWNGSKIGWFWGGMTVQGILPYYYNRVSINPMKPNVTRKRIIDRCIYNTMADTPECLTRSISEVKSAHFTICQKPWTCYGWGGGGRPCTMPNCNPLCKALHEEWFRLRKEAEVYYGIPVTPNACDGSGKTRYIPMAFSDARAGSSGSIIQLPVPDDSPSYLKPPKPESRYREDTEEWDNFVGGHVNAKKEKGKEKVKVKVKEKVKGNGKVKW